MSKSLTVMCSLLLASLGLASAPKPKPLPISLSLPSSSPRTEVLVLGVYHMANPGHDLINMKADDVFAPKRQAEIAELVTALKRFNPTRIAVECDPNDARLSSDYSKYVAGSYKLTRNEIDQIGFRLAKKLGHKAIYGVDADGEFPYPRLVKYAQATGRSKELNALMDETGATVKAENDFLSSHTILEALLSMNSDKQVAEAMGGYYRQVHFGEPGDWAGADLVSDWVRRNMRIHSNVVGLTQAPDERILVIYGAGHLGWLRASFGGDPAIRLRQLAEFVHQP